MRLVKKIFLIIIIFIVVFMFLRILREPRFRVVQPEPTTSQTVDTSKGSSGPNFDLSEGDRRGTLKSGGYDRTYLLHIPNGLEQDSRYPLILVFHGGGFSNVEQLARRTKFSEYADKKKFFVVYPEGIEHNWNDGRGTTEPEKMGVDDVQFVRDLITHLSSVIPVDNSRIYATGVSNGGNFSHRLACEATEIFAAIGAVSSAMPANLKPKCHPSGPIPFLGIQGSEDPFIAIEGGRRGQDCREKVG